MVLKTYRVNQKKGSIPSKLTFFNELYLNCLTKDPYWHFFLDEEGGTLRFQPKFEKRIKKFAEQYSYISLRRRKDYEPLKHEYYGVSYLGDDLLPLFHEMSVLSAKYPTYVIMGPILERLNHGLVNMAGIHNFSKEADLYLTLAYNRAELGAKYGRGEVYRVPKWVHRYAAKFYRYGKGVIK